jgi:DNA-directed RNA polymerase subunit RPC12/RpoP
MILDQVKINKQEMITVGTSFRSKSIPGNGLYSCINCSAKWLLEDFETLPECPECGALQFQKESLISTF